MTPTKATASSEGDASAAAAAAAAPPAATPALAIDELLLRATPNKRCCGKQQPEAGGGGGGLDPLQRFPAEVLFMVELYLPVQALIALSAVSRDWRLHMSESHWQQIFDARWSHCYETPKGRLTVSPSILSRLSGNYHSFWSTIERAFMGDPSVLGGQAAGSKASSAGQGQPQQQQDGGQPGQDSRSSGLQRRSSRLFERLFKFLQPQGSKDDEAASCSSSSSSYSPFFLLMMNAGGAGRTGPAALPSWKLACVLRDRSGTNVLMGCRLCSQLDVFTPHMRELELSCPTTPRTWVVPCLCPSLVHRRCLETQLMMGRLQQLAPHGGGPLPRRGWISYDSAPLEELPTSLGLCKGCGASYALGFRLPTVGELIWVTWNDSLAWARACDCVLMWVAGLAIVSLSEALYQGRGDLLDWPAEGGHVLFWWMFQYVISLNIFLSPRFARVVDLLWLGPIFSFYAKLYSYFLAATATVVLTFTPLPRRTCPWLFPPGASGYPLWWLALGWCNMAVLWVITSIVIFLFWRTNYRMLTLADRRQTPSFLDDHPMLSIGATR